MAIGDEEIIYFGITKQLKTLPTFNIDTIFSYNYTREPFFIYEASKTNTAEVIKLLDQVPKLLRKQTGKLAKKLYKEKMAGTFSNQPKTKIIVF